jgi:hypothetical protein
MVIFKDIVQQCTIGGALMMIVPNFLLLVFIIQARGFFYGVN